MIVWGLRKWIESEMIYLLIILFHSIDSISFSDLSKNN